MEETGTTILLRDTYVCFILRMANIHFVNIITWPFASTALSNRAHNLCTLALSKRSYY